MRTRDKQRIYRRFFKEVRLHTTVENIIREGHAKGQDSGKQEVK
jgi:hypothetical protein